MKLEVIVVRVSDGAQARQFHGSLGCGMASGREPIRVVTMITAAVVVHVGTAVAVIWHRVKHADPKRPLRTTTSTTPTTSSSPRARSSTPTGTAAWRDFDAWQVESEKERRSWEEGAGE